ncbi:MAG: UDP-N-acetylmuramoyl-tripeptide--D-alanyl-D-alanine ligase [Muribaculaceae bacterium]|nr:UDP-N-acetylmuramoyl-tripeptide--D-alanyl-D-alanine ligase [Muribaculaceae bacterium]
MILTIYCIAAIAAVFCVAVELRRCLMMFQQNSYRSERYRAWLRQSGDTTSWWRMCGLIVFFIGLLPLCPPTPAVVMSGVFALLCGTSMVRRKYKKPLVMTMRARRIYFTSLVLVAAVAGCAVVAANHTSDVVGPTTGLFVLVEALLACYCGSHLIILGANLVLTPVEKRITARYYNEAASILASMPALKVIGVTGSYGKTTTKHYLYRILSEKYETLMTPGSYNTTLGVVRTIRELLKPYHEVFVCEMGAKNVGDIKEICDLVHPWAGVVTAVGPQHLESFKTIENVQATKFELVDSLPSDGLAVINNDFEKIADRPVSNVRCIRYAVKNTDGADYVARDIEYTPSGTRFKVVRVSDGHELSLFTHLVGECNISNLLAAVAIAQALGVADEQIAYAVDKIEQVEHRLSVKRVPGGITIIDDAFNSNPVGSAMALDVLSGFKGGKRFLITPGMIELGAEQYERNRDFGFKAASCCDIAIVVGQYNREAILEGLREGNMPAEAIRPVESFTQAQQLLMSMSAPGDTVLYENDLPDTFK